MEALNSSSQKEKSYLEWPTDSQKVSSWNYFVLAMILLMRGVDGRDTVYVVEQLILRKHCEMCHQTGCNAVIQTSS